MARLRDEHGLTASVASLKRYVAANLPEEVRRDRVVVLRDEADTPPGEEAQIDQRAWTEAHIEAFRFFGGVPRRLVPDNLRTGVDKPDLYDPKLNRSRTAASGRAGARRLRRRRPPVAAGRSRRRRAGCL